MSYNNQQQPYQQQPYQQQPYQQQPYQQPYQEQPQQYNSQPQVYATQPPQQQQQQQQHYAQPVHQSGSTVVVQVGMSDMREHPAHIVCPHCQAEMTTVTSKSISGMQVLACFGIAFIGCIFGCCFIPFCIDQGKNVSHKCPSCQNTLTTYKPWGF